MTENLVKVFYVADPSKTREVPRDAAEYMKPRWQRVDGVGTEPKKKDAAPVEVNPPVNLGLEKLKDEYKKISGKDPDPGWTTNARVHIEIKKLEASLINEVIAPTAEEIEKVTPAPVLETLVHETPELTKPEPKKRGPKAKVKEQIPA